MTEMIERVAIAIAEQDGINWEGALGVTRNRYRLMARAAIAVAQEEFAKIAESVTVSANGHPQMDAPTLGDMQRAIVAAIRNTSR